MLCRLSFYFYGVHRDLHSFPTRRSSDLSDPQAAAAQALTMPSGQFKNQTLANIASQWAQADSASALAWVRNLPAGDRKSTRLNSSHQIISYAVFCLKKKKTDGCISRRTV